MLSIPTLCALIFAGALSGLMLMFFFWPGMLLAEAVGGGLLGEAIEVVSGLPIMLAEAMIILALPALLVSLPWRKAGLLTRRTKFVFFLLVPAVGGVVFWIAFTVSAYVMYPSMRAF